MLGLQTAPAFTMFLVPLLLWSGPSVNTRQHQNSLAWQAQLQHCFFFKVGLRCPGLLQEPHHSSRLAAIRKPVTPSSTSVLSCYSSPDKFRCSTSDPHLFLKRGFRCPGLLREIHHVLPGAANTGT